MKIYDNECCIVNISRTTGDWLNGLDLLQINWVRSGALGSLWPMLATALLTGILLALKVWRLLRIQKHKELKIAELEADHRSLEEDIKDLSDRNDWLVTEMHHRVKNNLQILNSLLSSQLAYVKDRLSREALFSSKHRLYAISLVHQKLFETSMISTLEMSCYIKELADYLLDEYHGHESVKLELDLASLKLDISVAIPLAQIINELISNSLKFAFPGSNSGVIKITLAPEDRVRYKLSYADNGVGLPKGTDFNSGRSLGRSLIVGLAGQIKAGIEVYNTAGLAFDITFKVAPQQNYLTA